MSDDFDAIMPNPAGGDLFGRACALAAEIRQDEAAGCYVDLGGRIARFAAAEAQRQLDELATKLGLAIPD